jgi:F-type H+-transporting ATPase subunit epsilon
VKTFELLLQDATHAHRIPGVAAFVGEDASGSFGILAGHTRLMTSLSVGLARFRDAGGSWRYLAQPGALLYFHDNQLTLSTRHFLLGNDYTAISAAMRQQLLAEEEELHTTKSSLHRMEEEMLRRMWRLGRAEA